MFGNKPATGGFGGGGAAAGAGGFGGGAAAGGAAAGGAGGFGQNKPATGFGGGGATAGGGFGGGGAAAGGAAAGGAAAGGAGGFGQNKPATGGFGGGAAAGAGGFGGGAAAGGGFGGGGAAAGGAGGFGQNKPATGGFGGGTAGAGGFGGTATAGPNPQQVQEDNIRKSEARLGVAGPGYQRRDAPHWSVNVDLTSLRDDILFESLPPTLQTFLVEMHAFKKKQKQIHEGLQKTFDEQDGDSKTGSKVLEERFARITRGSHSLDATTADCTVWERSVDRLRVRVKALTDYTAAFEKGVWEPLRMQGEDSISSGHRAGVRGTSKCIFKDTIQWIGCDMERIDSSLQELEAAVAPQIRQGGDVAEVNQMVNSAYAYGLHQRVTPANVSTTGAHFASNYYTPTSKSISGERRSNVESIIGALNNEFRSLSQVGRRVGRAHTTAERAKQLFSQTYGVSEARKVFSESNTDRGDKVVLLADLLKGKQGSYHYNYEKSSRMAHSYNASFSGSAYQAEGESHMESLLSTFQTSAGAPVMRFDTQIATKSRATKKAAATPATTAAPAATAPATGGFGAAAPATTAPATGGFGAAAPATTAPASGGFGAAAPAATAPATGGFGAAAPAATAPVTGGFGGFGKPAGGGKSSREN